MGRGEQRGEVVRKGTGTKKYREVYGRANCCDVLLLVKRKSN